MEDAEVEKFGNWSILVGRTGRSKNGGHFILKIPNFIEIEQKTQNMFENFCYWTVLAGWAGRTKNGRSHI